MAGKTGRGGMRPGAGRKPLPLEQRLRNRVMFAVTDAELRELAEASGDEALSAFLRRIVRRYLARRRK